MCLIIRVPTKKERKEILIESVTQQKTFIKNKMFRIQVIVELKP